LKSHGASGNSPSGARKCSRALISFMNSDQGVDPDSLNQFAYCHGIPLTIADFNGMDPHAFTDGRDPKSREAAGGDPASQHKSMQDGIDAATNFVDEKQHPYRTAYRNFMQRWRNLQLGVGPILNSEVPAFLAKLKITNPIEYGMITTTDPIVRSLRSGGFLVGQITPVGLNPAEFAGLTPAEIDALATQKGLVPKGPSPTTGQGAYTDPVTGEQRVLVHSETNPPHMHVNDPSGARLDINGNPVAPESPDAHLPLGQP
jgi:hypothetical protein